MGGSRERERLQRMQQCRKELKKVSLIPVPLLVGSRFLYRSPFSVAARPETTQEGERIPTGYISRPYSSPPSHTVMASTPPHLGKGDLLVLEQQGEDHGAVHR